MRATGRHLVFWLFILVVSCQGTRAQMPVPGGEEGSVSLEALQPHGYVNDFAGVIDLPNRQKLEKYCGDLARRTGAQLVTIVSLNGEPLEHAATSLFNRWGIGQKGKNNGVMLLLAIEDRKSRLEVGYGLESTIPNDDAKAILDAMIPSMRAGRYGEALVQASAAIGKRVSAGAGK